MVKRRTIISTSKTIASAVLALAMLCGPAFAAKYTIKGATGTNETVPLGRVGKYFKEIVEEKSNGQIEVKWYPAAQLGGEVAILNQLNDGIIQFATLSTAISSTLNPKLDIAYLPYFMPDTWETFENKFNNSAAADELLGSLGRLGIGGHALIPYGVDVLTYKGDPIQKLEDCKGRKLRSAESVNIKTTLESIGFNAVPLPWPEVYQSIQTKVVEGLTTPPAYVKLARFHEVVDNVTLAGHLFGMHVFWLRDDALNKLPENLREIVRSAAKESSDRAWRESRDIEKTIVKELEEMGIKVWRLSDSEKVKFMKATVSVVQNFEKRIDKSSGDGRAFLRKMYQGTGQDYDKLVN